MERLKRRRLVIRESTAELLDQIERDLQESPENSEKLEESLVELKRKEGVLSRLDVAIEKLVDEESLEEEVAEVEKLLERITVWKTRVERQLRINKEDTGLTVKNSADQHWSRMKMKPHWRILFVLPFIVLQGFCVRICELRDERVFCQCDGYEVDKVRTVTCNFISNITGEDEIWTGFEEQRMVESLSLNGRGEGSLTTIPIRALQITRHLLEIMFTGNRLGILKSDSFVDMEKLSRIDLEQNEITGIQENTFNNLPNLTTLVLSENNLRYLPVHTFQRLPNLKELFLDRNVMESIADHAFQHLHGLVELDLNSNKLGHISSKTFVGLRALKRLDLSRNSLTSLKDRIFRSSSELLDLDLSRNRITEITPHAFDGLKRLQKLNLKDNKLYNLQKTIFKGATHLIQINLGDNKLLTLQKHILDPLVNVSNPEFVITLKGNPFECRCDLLWISSFVNNSKTHSESLGLKKELKMMKCTFSEHRKSTPISVIDLRRDEMICPDPEIVKPRLHMPLHTSLLQKAPSTTSTISSVTTEQTSVLFPRVHTLSAIAEDNRVELRGTDDDEEGQTTIRVPIVRATVKASAGKIEPKNIELSDAAESTGTEPKAKTAKEDVDDTNDCTNLDSPLQVTFIFLWSLWVHAYSKSV